ncbi:RNA polymerase factor sigma-54 [Candidatus Magnetomonas plexicatena]|uniref:RNA polymerase factor sigma-54 n=1 Tax=Candidatus Magnetomonas plexicatena TaxID=2552947 RepID=UPI001C78BA22|nr:RNA polymerase factor sigma-54 [Nitrospirales bacterium LBB_01]
MALEARLEARLSQKLVLTPQLQMAIKLLQLPQLELTQAINLEIIENPFLEEHMEDLYQGEPEGGLGNEPEARSDGDNDGAYSEVTMEGLTSFSVDEYFEERGADGRDLGYFTAGEDEKPGFETFLSESQDLTDHLKLQLDMSAAHGKLKEAAEMIIGNIDENGYLRATVEELAKVLGEELLVVEKALKLVQSFDPPGVGARDIKECLIIQIKILGLEDTLVEKIIGNNLEDLERKKYQAIARSYRVTLEEVMVAVKIIEGLEPKPARNFSNVSVSFITPDVYVEKVDDLYKILLNDEHTPRVRISSKYRELLKSKTILDKTEKQFLLEKYRSATWLIKSLDERNRTIYRVTESILRRQREFFDNGIQYLKPLNLKTIAEDVSVHESNISRVTSNKYLACGHGVYPFRFFFSNSLGSDDGDISSTTVKELIKKIICEEDKTNPLTDQKLMDILSGKGIKIARRTLAKYREELSIAPHTKRKKTAN